MDYIWFFVMSIFLCKFVLMLKINKKNRRKSYKIEYLIFYIFVLIYKRGVNNTLRFYINLQITC